MQSTAPADGVQPTRATCRRQEHGAAYAISYVLRCGPTQSTGVNAEMDWNGISVTASVVVAVIGAIVAVSKARIEAASTTTEAFNKLCTQLQSRIDALEDEIARLRAQLENERRENEKLRQRIRALEEEREQLRQKLARIEAQQHGGT